MKFIFPLLFYRPDIEIICIFQWIYYYYTIPTLKVINGAYIFYVLSSNQDSLVSNISSIFANLHDPIKSCNA